MIINLGILAHVDAGKTTTVEQILYKYGKLRSLGSVDKGNTHTDFLEIERERGISVASASVSVAIDGHMVNIIDTPGHMDFTGEVERTLSVLDGVVLIVSAAEGIQSQTERFWKALREMAIPTLIFMNKTDRTGAEPHKVLEALWEEFSPQIIDLNNINPEALCENDDDLMELYLADQLTPEAMTQSLKAQTMAGQAFPLVYGAAAQGIGVEELVQAVLTYLPTAPLCPQGNPTGIIYKIEHDKTLGKIAHTRLFTGTIANRDGVSIHRKGAEPFMEKVTQIRKISGAKREDVPAIYGNEIAAICGLVDAKAGDMLGEILARSSSKIAMPLFTVQVFGPVGKETQLIQAISELSDEDPLLEYSWNHQERELVIRTMGSIQLEVLEFLLMHRYNLPVKFSPPSVIYKETVATTAQGHESYTMPKPCWAIVTLEATPLPRGSGFVYESRCHKSVLQERYQNHVEAATYNAIKQGRLGWEATDMKISLLSGESHIYHTHPMDFFLATPIAVMRALVNARPTLLEPLVKLRLTTVEELSGRLIGDIIKMRGEFDSPVIKDGKLEMEAIVPVATSMDYSIRFSSLTSGKGIIKQDFYGYKDCPMELGAMAKRREVDPLDRDKWILYKRGAL